VPNPVCSNPSDIKCANGECQADITSCTGEPQTNDLQDITFVVTDNDRDKPIQLNLVHKGTGSGGLGAVAFPPNMLQDGWNVTITQGSAQQDTSESDGCGSANSYGIASIPIKIEITDSDGNPVNHFNNSFELTLFGILNDQHESACLGYRSQDDDDWSCDQSTTDKQSTRSNSVFVVKSKFDHLTSFAVLLGGSSMNGCRWGWIEYASMGMIGGAVALTLLSIVLHCFSEQFRALIHGQDERRAISSIQRKVKRTKTNSATKNPIF